MFKSVNIVFIAIPALVLIICAMLVMAVGPRGSDQFWYAGYVDCLFENARPCTNYITPTAWGSVELPPPIHHVPALYVAALFKGLGSHAAWIASNVIFVGIGILFVYLAVFSVFGVGYAMTAVVVILAFPLTPWLTLNALGEASLFAYVAMFLYGTCALTKGRFLVSMLFMVLSAVLFTLSRSDGLILFVVMLGIVSLVKNLRGRDKTLALGIAIIAPLLWLSLATIFPKYPSQGLSTILVMGGTGIPGGNMIAFYAESALDFSFMTWATKAIRNLQALIFPSSVYDLLFGFPSLLIAFIIAPISGFLLRKQLSPCHYLSILPAISLLCISTLFQYQARYWFPYIPIFVFFLIALLWQLMKSKNYTGRVRRIQTLMIFGISIISVFITLTLTQIILKDAHEYNSTIERIWSHQADFLSSDAVLILNSGEESYFAYALPNSKVLVANTDINDFDSIVSAIKRFKVNIIIAPTNERNAVEPLFAMLNVRESDTISLYLARAANVWIVTDDSQ